MKGNEEDHRRLADAAPPDELSLRRDEITFLQCVQIVWERRYAIASFSFAAVVCTMVYCLMQPKIFESTTTIITKSGGAGGGFLSMFKAGGVIQSVPGLAGSGLSIPSFSPDVDLFVSILNSRTVGEATIERFDLEERYQTGHIEDALRRLRGSVVVSVSKEGVVGITVGETDPQLAARLANFYVAELDRQLRTFGNVNAARKREFIEKRLRDTLTRLKDAEEALKDFQKTHGAFALTEQARGIMDAATRIQAQIIATQVSLESTRLYATDENPRVRQLKKELAELRKQLAAMQFGVTSPDSGAMLAPVVERLDRPEPVDTVHVPFAEYPDIRLELERLQREVAIQGAVYTLLTQQLEEAKIAEVIDLPSVQVLDEAVPAARKSRPAIRKSMLTVGVASVFLGILAALAASYASHLRRQWAALKQHSHAT